MNTIQPIPLSTTIRLISKMIKISNITVTIPYNDSKDKLELKIKSDSYENKNAQR
jgi:hypothetical protein